MMIWEEMRFVAPLVLAAPLLFAPAPTISLRDDPPIAIVVKGPRNDSTVETVVKEAKSIAVLTRQYVAIEFDMYGQDYLPIQAIIGPVDAVDDVVAILADPRRKVKK